MPKEERKNGCPSSLLLSHTLLKGRIKHSSELAATQSERSDSKRLQRGGVTALTGKQNATKGPGRLYSARRLRKLRRAERRETNDKLCHVSTRNHRKMTFDWRGRGLREIAVTCC